MCSKCGMRNADGLYFCKVEELVESRSKIFYNMRTQWKVAATFDAFVTPL